MKLKKAFESLYNLLALDKSIRDELLKELVEDKSVCFLLGLPMYYSPKIPKVTRGASTVNYDYQLASFLQEPNSYWESLGLQEQVVLREIFNGAFDSTILYAYGVKVYNKKEVMDYLKQSNVESVELLYLLLDIPKYYYEVRSSIKIKSTIPRGIPPYIKPLNHQGIVIDGQGNTLATGGVSFGKYLMGKGRFKEIEGDFSKADNLPEIQYRLNKQSKEVSALVFHPEGILILTKESLKVTYDILDLVVSEDFEPIGLWINHKEKNYKVRCEIPQSIIDRGVDKYEVVIRRNELLNGTINNIKFIKLKLKETYEIISN